MEVADVEISRKISVFSVLSERYDEQRKISNKNETEKEPKDFLYLVHITCFFIGFMNVMPMIFFSTAQSYWMYKFRNASIAGETTEGQDRTPLQVHFQPALMAGSTIPGVVFTLLLTFHGHKIAPMLRTISALVLLGIVFAIFVIFTQVNTDSWQTGFFVMTVMLLMLNSGGTAIFQMSSVILMSKLHPKYMFWYLLGQNGTLLSSSLQIISLAVTDKSVTSGLIYFSAGTVLITISLMFILNARRSEVFKHYEVENSKDQHAEHFSLAEMKQLTIKIWPSIAVLAIMFFSSSFFHPSITTLIVSEYESEKTSWTEKFFTPTTVFIVAEIASVIGRFLSKNFVITNTNKWWYVLLIMIRTICLPFYLFCNAQPRKHLPVVFGHDWEFMLGHAAFSLLTGFFLNVAFMSIRTLAGTKTEAAFKILSLGISLISAASTFNGFLTVMII